MTRVAMPIEGIRHVLELLQNDQTEEAHTELLAMFVAPPPVEPIVTEETVAVAVDAYRDFTSELPWSGGIRAALEAALAVQPKPQLTEREANLTRLARTADGHISESFVHELAAIVDRLTGNETK